MPAEPETLNRAVFRSAVELDNLRNSAEVRDEVKHNHLLLPLTQSKTAAELLHEDASAVGGPHEYDQVYIRNIHTLVK